MGEFKNFLRFEHGTGMWIDRKGNKYTFGKGMTHEEWAQTNRKKSTGDLMRDGWARVRILPQDIVFQTNNPDSIWDAIELMGENPNHRMQFEFKGHKWDIQLPDQLEKMAVQIESLDFPNELS